MPGSPSFPRPPVFPLVASLVAVLAGGCVIPKSVGNVDDDDDDETSDPGTPFDVGDGSPGGTSAAGTSGPTSGEPDPASGTSPVEPFDVGDGGSFIFLPDGAIVDPCNPWAQDCSREQKCTPAELKDGGNQWDWARCAPVVADPDAVGEPCTMEGSPTSGIDTCVLGAMCWDVDPDSLEGTCVALCTGSEDAPLCEPQGTACAIANDGALIVCLPSCDPMLQDCEPGDACSPVGDVFVCTPAGGADPGGVGDSCEDIAVCDPGLACTAPELVPDCTSDGCCTSLCDLTDPMPPCLPGQSCTPYYEPGTAPEGFEDVGLCTLPA